MSHLLPPRIIRWIFLLFAFFMMGLTTLRVFFFYIFRPSGVPLSEGLSSFWLGARYDARVVSIILLPLVLIGILNFKKGNPFHNSIAKKIFFIWLGTISLGILIGYVLDYYYYAYLTQRLNGNILNFIDDAGISMKMVWQSYPVIWIFFFFGILLTGMIWVIWKLFNLSKQYYLLPRINSAIFYFTTFIFFILCIYGKINQFPLRWSDAFTMADTYKANLALNPFQSFFSSLQFRHSGYEIKKVRENYSIMARYLDINDPDSVRLNFSRFRMSGAGPDYGQANVILILCESFSAYKSSMWNNPLNTTPFFDSLSRKGLFFDRCFTPHFGTARGVWATITGVPDVTLIKTTSRNPAAVDQETIINNFLNLEKFYFLGGNASWANIRGLLTNNIKDLNLYEQKDFTSPKNDVWGISDMNLFLEASRILGKQQKPFFAMIQTSGNHRPYTIPREDRTEFKIADNIPADSLEKYGFESMDELNAFRYTDYCFRKFMEAAGKENFIDNTIFVFVGDHGIRSKYPLAQFPASWVQQGLTCEHVPLLFYYPKGIKARRVSTIASQVDILPTIAGILNVPYVNSGMGKDLYNHPGNDNYAFIMDHDTHQIGIVHDNYYFLRNISTEKEEFVSIVNNEPILKNSLNDSIKNKLRTMTIAYYETARYLLLNNKPRLPLGSKQSGVGSRE